MGKFPAEMAIELPAGLHLDASFLGLVKPATIGGLPVDIVLPDYVREGDGPAGGFVGVVDGRARVDWAALLVKEDIWERLWPFGSPNAWKGDEVKEFYAIRLLALPIGAVTLEEARDFQLSVDGWVRLLELWIEVFSREDLHRNRIRVDRHGKLASIWIDQGEPGGRGEILREEQDAITVELGRPLPIEPQDWEGILAKASAGEEPPAAHVFIRDSRQALDTGHHRRAVLDAATAAEIALADLRDEAVKSATSELAGYIASSVTRIEGIAKFLRKVGQTLPQQITEDIGQPRNSAIHKGHDPDAEEAGRALRKAEEIVDLASPWASLI